MSILVFLLAGYEYLTLMHFPVLPETRSTDNKSDQRKVTIVLPVRNQFSTLDSCLKSLVNLDYSNKQIIVVEGDSTDGTKQILQNYADGISLVQEEPLPEGWVGKSWACH